VAIPVRSRGGRDRGELTIDFVIERSGAVNSIELVALGVEDPRRRGGPLHPVAAPFDPIPAGYKIPTLQIRGRFVYVHGGALRLR